MSLAWASLGLGGVALRRGQNAEAARNFTDAIRADAEYAATLTARAERIKAEPAGTVDEAVAYILSTQLDTALRGGRQAEIVPLMVPGELTRFVQQVVGTQPEAWATRVLRTEQLDANRVARRRGPEHAAVGSRSCGHGSIYPGSRWRRIQTKCD